MSMHNPNVFRSFLLCSPKLICMFECLFSESDRQSLVLCAAYTQVKSANKIPKLSRVARTAELMNSPPSKIRPQSPCKHNPGSSSKKTDVEEETGRSYVFRNLFKLSKTRFETRLEVHSIQASAHAQRQPQVECSSKLVSPPTQPLVLTERRIKARS